MEKEIETHGEGERERESDGEQDRETHGAGERERENDGQKKVRRMGPGFLFQDEPCLSTSNISHTCSEDNETRRWTVIAAPRPVDPRPGKLTPRSALHFNHSFLSASRGQNLQGD